MKKKSNLLTFNRQRLLKYSYNQAHSDSIPVAGAVMWLRADGLVSNSTNTSGTVDGSGDVTLWDDLTGNGNYAFFDNAIGTKPALSGLIGSKKAIKFDGVLDNLQIFNKSLARNISGATAFVVCRASSITAATENEIFFFSGAGSDNGRLSLSVDFASQKFRTRCRRLDSDTYLKSHQILGTRDVTADTVFNLKVDYSTGLGIFKENKKITNWEAYINDTQGSTSNTASKYASIGCLLSNEGDGNFPFNGWISEIILFDSVLSEADCDTICDWLMNYYSITEDSNPATQAEFTAYMNRLTALGYTLPSAQVQTALNRFIYKEVTNGNWAKLDRLGLFQIGNSNASLVDLIDPTKSLTLMGSPTYDSKGYIGNGSSMYIKTGFIPSSGVNYIQNKSVMGAYGRKNGVDAGVLFGAKDASNAVKLYPRYTDGIMYGGINQATGTSTSETSYSGFGVCWAKRTGASTQLIGINNDTLKSTGTASVSRPTEEVYLLAHNNNGSAAEYYNGQVSAWFAGSSDINLDLLIADIKAFEAEIGILS